MSLFTDPAAWQTTAGASTGLVLGESFIDQATNQQLQEIFSFLNQHHLKLAMVTAMIPVQANGLGNGIEGFTSGTALATALHRISSLGGTLDTVGMDGVVFAGHYSPSGAQLSMTALAQAIAPNVALVQSYFPAAKFAADDGSVITSGVAAFSQAFLAATGTPVAEYDADVNWGAQGQVSQLEAYAAAARAAGAVFGVVGNSTNAFTSNQSWALAAEANIAAAMADPLVRPASIQIETWDPYPTVTLPEGLSGTLSHIAVEAAETTPLYASGYLKGGTGVSVATAVPTASYVGSALDAVAGAAVSVPGVSLAVTARSPAWTTFAVVVTDVSGTLGAVASGAGAVSGAGSNVILLTGTLADINAELASLTYAGSAVGGDRIDVTTYDGAGLMDDHQIAVSVAAPPAVSLPAGITASALFTNIFGAAPAASVLAPVLAAVAAGQTLAQAASGWLAQAQSAVSALCEQVQGATASSAAVASLTTALAEGASPASIRTALAQSAPVQAELSAVYQSRYGAAPTAPQLAALTQHLAAGASLQAVEAPLLANSQAEAQITALYQQVAGQAPGASDLLTAARALVTGTALASIQAQLAASGSVQGNLAAMFQHVYDVAPTAAQLASLTAELDGTTTYAQIQAQFTAVARTMVTAAYESVLNRTPTAAELASHMSQITAGISSEGDVFGGLAFSAGSGANVAAIYQQVTGQAPPQSMVTTLEQCLCIGSDPITLTQLKTDLGIAASLYTNITGLTVTAAALSPLMYDFLNKAPVDLIAFSVAHSGQVSQILQSAYQALFGNGMTGTEQGTIEAALQAGTMTMAGAQALLIAQAAADVPVLSNVVANQSITENADAVPLGALTLADPDAGAIETVTVSVTGGAAHFTDWAACSNAAHTVFTRTGSAAMLQGDLRVLTLANATPGSVATLVVTVTNSAGHSASDTVTITTQALRSTSPNNMLFMPAVGLTVAANAGFETFAFPASGFGEDTIAGFDPVHDVIQLPRAMAASFANIQSHESAIGGGTLIAFGPSESITLAGIAPGSLHASNFQFA